MNRAAAKFLGELLILIALPLLCTSCSPAEDVSIKGYLCNSTLCNRVIAGLIDKASIGVACALYSVNSKVVLSALDMADGRIKLRVVTNNPISKPYSKTAKTSALMHNKFCIFDGKVVLTGSFNPGNSNEMNSIVVIQSPELAELFTSEFEELWAGIFGKGEASNGGHLKDVKAYFCPEDDCGAKMVSEIMKAKHEISFLYYSFTLGEAGLAILAMHRAGVKVKGVFEESQLSNYSVYQLLKYQGLNVKTEGSSAILHHKLMIIDNTTILIGSFNPTQNAQLRNDENLLIIRNPNLAIQYAQSSGYAG